MRVRIPVKAGPMPEGTGDELADAFPNISGLLANGGEIQLGYEEMTGSFARALAPGGLYWTGGTDSMTITELLAVIEEAISDEEWEDYIADF